MAKPTAPTGAWARLLDESAAEFGIGLTPCRSMVAENIRDLQRRAVAICCFHDNRAAREFLEQVTKRLSDNAVIIDNQYH